MLSEKYIRNVRRDVPSLDERAREVSEPDFEHQDEWESHFTGLPNGAKGDPDRLAIKVLTGHVPEDRLLRFLHVAKRQFNDEGQFFVAVKSKPPVDGYHPVMLTIMSPNRAVVNAAAHAWLYGQKEIKSPVGLRVRVWFSRAGQFLKRTFWR